MIYQEGDEGGETKLVMRFASILSKLKAIFEVMDARFLIQQVGCYYHSSY